MKKFDVIVIGGGPGGSSAAMALSKAGRAVCLFEGENIGGTCLNVGCIPTKYLLDRAAALEKIRKCTEEGILRGAGEFSWKRIQAGREKTVLKLRSGLEASLRTCGVATVSGKAVLKKDLTVVCDGEEYSAGDIIIATGSSPAAKVLADSPYTDSTGGLSQKKLPERLLIVGGGVIGLELASAYRSFGSEVTVIELAENILGSALPAAARLLKSRLEARGIRFFCGTRLESTERYDGGIRVKTSSGEFTADTVIMANGRKPRLDGIDAEALGLKLNERGGIAVDGRMKTNLPHIYAIGDATGRVMLAHAAYADASVAVANILGKNEVSDTRIMPQCIYTYPMLASVGMTVSDAERLGIPASVGMSDFRANGMAVAEGEEGCAFAVVDKRNGKNLGFTVVGASACELIGTASIAVERGYTAEDWQHLTVAHPTLSECLKDAVLSAKTEN